MEIRLFDRELDIFELGKPVSQCSDLLNRACMLHIEHPDQIYNKMEQSNAQREGEGNDFTTLPCTDITHAYLKTRADSQEG